jgi:hypothetical protein
MIDLLFANGGNYSSPGEPEFSRVFINQGAGEKFKEITNQVFEDSFINLTIFTNSFGITFICFYFR